MQTYRIVPRTAPRACKAACSPTSSSSTTRNMFTTPFFPGSNAAGPFNHFAGELAPIFRVLDTAVSELAGGPQNAAARHHHRQQHRRSFTPRFDVREVGGSYELQGELPGLEQKDLEIEFVDDKTLVIRGRAVRDSDEQEQGNDTATAAEASRDTTATIEAQDNNNNENGDAASEKSASYHKASVEDEDGFVDAGAETAAAVAEKDASEVAKGKAPEGSAAAPDPETSVPETKASEPRFKYWVSERSVGEFERRFAFPGRVDQEAVKASLRNGILSVVVPKIVEQSARRIQIQ